MSGDAQTWLTAEQIAAYAQVGVKTVYREVKAGRLRAAVVGGRRELRFRKEFADLWLEQCVRPQEIQK
jgi:excisionase family DNA binding protein